MRIRIAKKQMLLGYMAGAIVLVASTTNVSATEYRGIKWACPIDTESYGSSIGTNGWLYLGNKYRTLAITPDGVITQIWGGAPYSGDGPYLPPAIGPDGTIFQEDGGTNYLHVLTLNSTNHWPMTYLANNPAAIGTDGKIYAVDFPTDRIGARLYCFNPDGTTNWTADLITPSGISRPALAPDGTIYVTTSDYGTTNAQLYSFSSNGTTNWVRPIGNNWGNPNSPALGADGTIYVGCYAANTYAMNPDGTTNWTGGGASGYTVVVVGTNGIYFGTYSDGFKALNFNGSLKWRANPMLGDGVTPVRFMGGPAIGADGNVYMAGLNTNDVYAWDVETGVTNYIFTNSIAGFDFFSQTHVNIGLDGTVYVTGNDPPRNLFALDVDAGRLGNTPWPRFGGGMRSTGRVLWPPKNVAASDRAFPAKVEVTWDAAVEALGYQVWRNTSNNTATATYLGVTTGTNYDDSTAERGGIQYYYWVKSTNEVFVTVFSDADTGSTTPKGTGIAIR